MWPFKRQKPAGLVVDPTEGDPRARALHDALESRDWRTARDVLSEATDPDTRAYLMEVAWKVDGVQEWIQQWIDAVP